jgi:hypothetical protein
MSPTRRRRPVRALGLVLDPGRVLWSGALARARAESRMAGLRRMSFKPDPGPSVLSSSPFESRADTLKSMAKQRALQNTAFHESGHAVVAYRLGVRFKLVSIRPNQERGSLGCVMLQNGPKWAVPDTEQYNEERARMVREDGPDQPRGADRRS